MVVDLIGIGGIQDSELPELLPQPARTCRKLANAQRLISAVFIVAHGAPRWHTSCPPRWD